MIMEMINNLVVNKNNEKNQLSGSNKNLEKRIMLWIGRINPENVGR